MKTASEMPLELQKQRDGLSTKYVFGLKVDNEADKRFAVIDFNAGFNKCFDLMSAENAEKQVLRKETIDGLCKTIDELGDAVRSLQAENAKSKAEIEILHERLRTVISQREECIKNNSKLKAREQKLIQVIKLYVGLRVIQQSAYVTGTSEEPIASELIKEIDQILKELGVEV